MSKYRYVSPNRNARLVQKRLRTKSLVTKLVGRDDGCEVEAKTANYGNGRTRLFIRRGDGEAHLVLNGAEARTVYRVLQRQYCATGRSW